jgi:membrane-bound inhibitor of C-type lysozyme
MPKFLVPAAMAVFSIAFIPSGNLAFAGSSSVQIAIPVPDADTVERRSVSYVCGESRISADYINAGSVALALLHIERGGTTVLANVTAGSGAKYMGGPYTLWIKGEAATLYDLRNGENTTGIECRAIR